MDRRTLLKSAAALSAASVATGATTLMPTAEAVTAPLVAPLKVSPYKDYIWEWFVSHDRETYYEGFATKEEAVQYAQQCDYSIIAECKQQDFNLEIDGGTVLERLNEDNYEQIGEGDGITCTRAQEHDLTKMLTKAMEAWVVKHKIDVRAWSFGGLQNETEVPESALS